MNIVDTDLFREHLQFFPLQVREEWEEFCGWLETFRLEHVIEIGTHTGGTLYYLAKKASGRTVSIGFDEVPFRRLRNELKRKLADTDCHFVEADSHREDTRDRVHEILKGEKVSLLFIDGDHSYGGVKLDFEMYREFVSDDGAVIFHDVDPDHVICKEVQLYYYNEIKPEVDCFEIIKRTHDEFRMDDFLAYVRDPAQYVAERGTWGLGRGYGGIGIAFPDSGFSWGRQEGLGLSTEEVQGDFLSPGQ